MPKRQSANRKPTTGIAPNDPALQGEGNCTAARRHRESVKDFIGSGRVEDAARKAAPDDAAEARELKQAEEAGLSHARK